MVFPTKFSDLHSSCFKAILSLYEKCRKSQKDHVTLQEVSTFAFVPEGLSKWELDDVWIDNWMCIKVLHR
jgi:site-specific recombinase